MSALRINSVLHMDVRGFLGNWLPLFLWVGVIYVGSTDLTSPQQTSRFLVLFLRWLRPDITADSIAQIQFFVRKVAHLTEYLILAVLLWRALIRGTHFQMQISILFIMVLFVCTIFAASDEFHQSFVSSRTASANDVMIDMCGALVGLAICWIVAGRRASRQARIASGK